MARTSSEKQKVPQRFLGIDLAWGEGRDGRAANESGVVALDPDGTIVDAGWAVGVDDVVQWIDAWAKEDTALFIDAPLLVLNETGMRRSEREVASRYGRWKVAANASNKASTRSAGVALLKRLEQGGWTYDDGVGGPQRTGRRVSECYPYTALVGAHEFGYVRDTEDRAGQRPRYKRKPKGMRAAVWHPARAANCDALIARFATFGDVQPPISLGSHAETRALVDTPSPHRSVDYKHREDLIDAAICAWTAALWHSCPERCVVLGRADDARDADGRRGTIIAPYPSDPGSVAAFERVAPMLAVDGRPSPPSPTPEIQPHD